MAGMKRPVVAFGISLGVLVLVAAGAEAGFRALGPAEAREPLASLRNYLLTGRTRARTSGVPRVACLGGSTTEGGNPQGRGGSYPPLLEVALEERTGRDFEVLNAGISSWTTNEMLVAWFLTIQDFQPDLVVLHEASAGAVPGGRAPAERAAMSSGASTHLLWRG
jgi:hypothetical protein